MSTWMGEPVIRIGGPKLAALVSPSRGGKIVSLVDENDREWLAQPASPLPPPAEPGAAFTAAELCGWDECAPTVDRDTYFDEHGEGVDLGDHGDLWTQRWQDHGTQLRVTSPSLGFDFARSIGATGRGLRLEYVVRSQRDLPLLWAAHPQFIAPPGSRVQVPNGTVLRGQDGSELGPEVLEIDSYADGECRKFHADPAERVGWASLVLPSDERLTLYWSASAPYLGIFMDAAAVARERVAVIEPMSGWPDSLSAAVDSGHVARITPDRPLTIRLEIGVG
jgi:hypothetical protein